MMILFRIVMIVVLLAIAAFCAFGFLASFEPPGFMGWRIAYGITGVACLIGMAWAIFAKSARRS